MTPVVLIIDRESGRSGPMADAFRGLNCHVVLAWLDGRGIHCSPGNSLPEQCAVRLWHLGDRGDLYIEACKSIQAKVTVYYGGDGGNDLRRPDDDGEIIWRPISTSASGVLNSAEAGALLAFALTGEGRPEFLKPSQTLEITTALAILCQGFLAVYAGHDLLGGSAGEFEALRRMGWDDGNHGEIVTGDSKLAAVQSVSWWLETFDLCDGGQLNESKWRKFTNGLRTEWGSRTGLDALADLQSRLRGQSAPSAVAVATAYNAIVDRLRPEIG